MILKSLQYKEILSSKKFRLHLPIASTFLILSETNLNILDALFTFPLIHLYVL